MDMLLLSNPRVSDARAEGAGGPTPLDLATGGEYPEREEVMEALTKIARPFKSGPSPRGGRRATMGGVRRASTPEVSRDEYDAPPGRTLPSSNDSRYSSPGGTRTPRAPRTPRTPRASRGGSGTGGTPLSATPHNTPSTPKALSTFRRIDQQAASRGNQTTISKLVEQLERVKVELAELRKDKKSRDDFVSYVEIRLSDKDAELESARREIEELKCRLSDTTARTEELTMRSEDMNGHVLALSGSLTSMMEERENIVTALRARDDELREMTIRRQKKLQALIDEADEAGGGDFGEDEPGGGDGGSGGNSVLREALESQGREMEAVTAILEAVQYSEGGEEGDVREEIPETDANENA